jgi:RNA polymerase sigma factor (sigma-70 family)
MKKPRAGSGRTDRIGEPCCVRTQCPAGVLRRIPALARSSSWSLSASTNKRHGAVPPPLFSPDLLDGPAIAFRRDDAFQATVEAAFRQLHSLQDPEKLVPWLIGIASRQSINQIRRLRRETQVEDVSDELLRNGPAPSVPPGLPDEEVLLMERAQQAREGLEALPERCRRILRSLFFEDPAPEYREIALREGIPLGNIGSLRVRCIERLRRVFTDRGWLDA